MKNKIISALAAAALILASCSINGPETGYSSDLPKEHRTEWTCVWYGSYPQAEVVASDKFFSVTGISLKDGDMIVNPGLYSRLEKAEWDGNETTIGGQRYRRMRGQDALTALTKGTGHYIFGDTSSWHYFKYEPLRWRVLKVSGNDAYLLSDRAIDCQEYDDSGEPSTWESSSVRRWLNSDFYDSAFSEDQKKGIILSDVPNPDNGTYGSSSGPDTQDHVFLLSTDEVVGTDEASAYGFYIYDEIDDPARRMKPTMYAMCRGAWISMVPPYVGNTYWFLRTSGFDENYFTYICEFGFIYPRGSLKSSKDGGIVPAMHVDLSKAKLKKAGKVSSDDIFEAEPEAAEAPENLEDVRYDSFGDLHCPENEISDDSHTYHWDKIEFGSYPQSKVTDENLISKLSSASWKGDDTEIGGIRYRRVNGEYFRYDPVCWRILNITGAKATLLADQVLDCKPFNEELTDTEWRFCSLRKWLNVNFYDEVFSDKEKKAVLSVPNHNVNNYYFNTQCYAATEDRIYLLSEEETFSTKRAIDYGFLDNDGVGDPARRFGASDYAVACGAWVSEDEEVKGNTIWLLRTSGYRNNFVVYVDEYGFMYNRGTEVSCATCGILPVVAIDLKAAGF